MRAAMILNITVNKRKEKFEWTYSEVSDIPFRECGRETTFLGDGCPLSERDLFVDGKSVRGDGGRMLLFLFARFTPIFPLIGLCCKITLVAFFITNQQIRKCSLQRNIFFEKLEISKLLQELDNF